MAQRISSAANLLLALLFIACSQPREIEGVIRDRTEHTLTIATERDVITFSTRGAKIVAPAGIHRGSPVVVAYEGEIADGFGNAERIEVPEEYNLLIGRWMAPCDEYHEEMHGFELMPDGEVMEIGDHSIIYNYWRYADGKLSMAEYKENLDEEIFDLVHHWRVELVDRTTLTISGYGESYIFARTSR